MNEHLGNVSETSRVNLESYLGKHIIKDFEGTTITQLLKNKDDGTPFLQLDCEDDGDQEEFDERI